MPLFVQKYGGSSLASPRHIRQAAQRIRELRSSGKEIVVVVSAMGRTTDHLIRLAQKTVDVPPQRELDMLMTAGERVSMALLAMALDSLGVPAISFTGSQSGIITTNEHTDAKILDVRAHRIREEISKGKVVIIAGFQGVSLEKEITTLGRGGSDTTAVALASALGAESCDILTDVDGLFTADPRVVAGAKLISTCTYDEALELATLGAKMQPRSLEMAKRYQVRVRIMNSAVGRCDGTLISDGKEKGKKMEQPLVRGVATKEPFHLFRVMGGLKDLVTTLSENKFSIRFFTQSTGEIRFLADDDKADLVKRALEKGNHRYEVIKSVALVSAVGEGLSNSEKVMPVFLQAVEGAGAEPFMIFSNAMSVSVAVAANKKTALANLMHDRLVQALK